MPDFMDGSAAARRDDVEPQRGLHSRDGVSAISGNHEYFFGADAWMEHFAGMGMRILANEYVVLRRGLGAVVLAGVTDLSPANRRQPHDL